jgi:hypothetical protein
MTESRIKLPRAEIGGGGRHVILARVCPNKTWSCCGAAIGTGVGWESGWRTSSRPI